MREGIEFPGSAGDSRRAGHGWAMRINQERVGEGAQTQTTTPRGSRCSWSHGGPRVLLEWGRELLAEKGAKAQGWRLEHRGRHGWAGAASEGPQTPGQECMLREQGRGQGKQAEGRDITAQLGGVEEEVLVDSSCWEKHTAATSTETPCGQGN